MTLRRRRGGLIERRSGRGPVALLILVGVLAVMIVALALGWNLCPPDTERVCYTGREAGGMQGTICECEAR